MRVVALDTLIDEMSLLNSLFCWLCLRANAVFPCAPIKSRAELLSALPIKEADFSLLVRTYYRALKPRVNSLQLSLSLTIRSLAEQGELLAHSSVFNSAEYSLIKEAFPHLPSLADRLSQPLLPTQTLLAGLGDSLKRIDPLAKTDSEQLKFWSSRVDIEEDAWVQGEVEQGKQLGRELGIPTANLTSACKCLTSLPNGIYRVKVRHQGKEFVGTGSLGVNPYVQAQNIQRKLQVYVHGWNPEVSYYGQRIRVDFQHLIRFEGRFPSFGAFLQTIWNDIQS